MAEPPSVVYIRGSLEVKAPQTCSLLEFAHTPSYIIASYITDMSHPTVRGVVVVTRNGDRLEYSQDTKNYKSSHTECTPLGEVQSHQLGSYLRREYFTPSSPSFIRGVRTDLVDTNQVQVRIKNGGEGRAVFDSAIALLQGLFPPTEKNSITLANETQVVAPLGGYQYVPVETVEPSNDRSLESWTDCPAFERHVKEFYASSKFKETERLAEGFMRKADDFAFGRTTNLENAVNLYDYMNHELIHNKTYAHRLPPTFIEQARHWANFHENGAFSDGDIGGIGNIAGRTILASIKDSLQRITYDGDPLQFLVETTTYQPFISLFHQIELIKDDPSLQGIPNYASALAIELRRGSLPDNRDFVRFKFKNGTSEGFRTLHAFAHGGDMPLTEFIYRIENAVISSNQQWQRVCGAKSTNSWLPTLPFGTDSPAESRPTAIAAHGAMFAALLMMAFFAITFIIRRVKLSRAQRIRLPTFEDHNNAGPSTVLIQTSDEKRRYM